MAELYARISPTCRKGEKDRIGAAAFRKLAWHSQLCRVVLLLNINKLPGSQPQTRSPQSSETKQGHFIIVSKQPTKARLLCHPPNPKHPPPLAQMSDCRCFTNDSFILVACLPFLEIRSEISRHRIVPAF